MSTSHASDPDVPRKPEELDRAKRARLERDWRLPMNERLARMHELCKQLGELAGAARPK